MAQTGSTIDDVSWWGYVERVSDNAPRVQIAKLVGLTPSAISRWASGANPDPDKAAALARAYERPVLEAFVAAGFLTEDEAGQQPAERPDLDQLTDDELLAEIGRRLAQRRTGVSDGGSSQQKMSSPGPKGALGAQRGPGQQDPMVQRRGRTRGGLGSPDPAPSVAEEADQPRKG